MLKHLVGLCAALAAPLIGFAQQQPPPKPNPNPTYIIPLPLRPGTTATPPAPKPPLPKTGIEAPKPRPAAPRVTPTMTPAVPYASESLDLSTWTKVAPAAFGLTFYMPSDPVEQTRTLRVGERELAATQYVFSLDDAGAFVFMCSDLPKERTASDAGVLRAAKDRVIQTLRGRVANEIQVEAGVVPGVEIRIRTPNDTVVRQRMFVRGDRLIQAIAAGPKEFVSSVDAEKFFRALRFDDVSGRMSELPGE
jgi:hypothetical protein